MHDEVRTTDGVIALRNLGAQLEALERIAACGRMDARNRGELVDLLALRGQIQKRAEDAERARALAEQCALDSPGDGWSWVRLARMRDTFHQFAAALKDLDRAEQLGLPSAVLNPERALAMHHLGHSEDALHLASEEAACHPGFTSLATLAVLHAERDEPAAAEHVFDLSLIGYRGVSPFPIAHLDLQRGRMWLRQGDLPLAHHWFAKVVQRVPGHVPAREHLARLEPALSGL